MAVTGPQRTDGAVLGKNHTEINPRIRPVSGSDRRPPDTCKLALEGVRQLWAGIHLMDPAALERAAAQCERFTSLVSLEPPDGLLLEIQGSLRFFGGLDALLAQLKEHLGRQSIAARFAVTPTPSSALWSVRASLLAAGPCDATGQIVDRLEELPRHLASVPLACLRWPEEQNELLAGLGVRTVADLLRLPRAGLARRLGRPWLEALDQALGRSAEPRRGFHAVRRYVETRELDTPIATTARLEAFLSVHLKRLERFLRVRQVAIGTLAIQLLHRMHPATCLRIATATPCAQIDRFRGLLHERLSTLQLPAAVSSIRLRSGPLLECTAASQSLLRRMEPDCNTDEAGLMRLVERLRARLGKRAIPKESTSSREIPFGIRSAADHRPEYAWRTVDVLSQEKSTAPPDSLPLRPVWLYPAPQLLPQDAPRRWTVECGPERIESGWWDGREAVRDYFVVRDSRGVRSWVYRDRRPPYRWYLHGLFG